MRNKKRRWLLAALIGLPAVLLTLYLLAFLGIFVFFPAAQDYSYRVPFEEKAWRERALDQAESQWPTRLRMIDDLVGKRRLEGLARADVLALLGPADQTTKWKEWDLVYWLGPERGPMGIDSEWLVIKFGSSDRVASYQIVRD